MIKDVTSLPPSPSPMIRMERGIQEEQTTAQPESPPSTNGDEVSDHLWAGKDFSFGDLVDMINPLQHIPILSSVYRKLTGDEIGNLPRLIGDTLIGGLLGGWISGVVTSLANITLKEASGQDAGEHLLTALTTPANERTASNQAMNSPDQQETGTMTTGGGDSPASTPASHGVNLQESSEETDRVRRNAIERYRNMGEPPIMANPTINMRF